MLFTLIIQVRTRVERSKCSVEMLLDFSAFNCRGFFYSCQMPIQEFFKNF